MGLAGQWIECQTIDLAEVTDSDELRVRRDDLIKGMRGLNMCRRTCWCHLLRRQHAWGFDLLLRRMHALRESSRCVCVCVWVWTDRHQVQLLFCLPFFNSPSRLPLLLSNSYFPLSLPAGTFIALSELRRLNGVTSVIILQFRFYT